MQTVVETSSYLSAAKSSGMTGAETKAVVDLIAANPKAGDLIVGSGGCRKVRIAGKGKGKSGGYRVITYFYNEDIPVFLLWVLSKGSVANLTDEQVKQLAKATKAIAQSYQATKKGVRDERH
jgi:hypothetical protein